MRFYFLILSKFNNDQTKILKTADQPCKFAKDIETFKNNALDKIWIQDYLPLGKTEASLMKGLQYSPVAFGAYISDNIFGYSGGFV